MINRDEIDPQGAIIRQTAETAVAISEELAELNPNIEIDAKEFGEHVRNGGWRLGLLVARSVEKGSAGRPSEIAKNLAISGGKISSRSFARAAGNISDPTVMKYLNSWNMAAADGLVPASSELSPGQGFSFDTEEHTPKVWDSYFKPPAGDKDDKTVEDTIIKPIERLAALSLREWICTEQYDGSDSNLNNACQAFKSLIRMGHEGLSLCEEVARSLDMEINDGAED